MTVFIQLSQGVLHLSRYMRWLILQDYHRDLRSCAGSMPRWIVPGRIVMATGQRNHIFSRCHFVSSSPYPHLGWVVLSTNMTDTKIFYRLLFTRTLFWINGCHGNPGKPLDSEECVIMNPCLVGFPRAYWIRYSVVLLQEETSPIGTDLDVSHLTWASYRTSVEH